MKTTSLPPKLEAVLLRLGRAAQLNVTQAVKLPYIVDVVANRVLGHPITEGSHETWENGVVTSQVWHYLTKADDPDVFRLEPVPWSEERKVVVAVDDKDAELTEDEQKVVDYVAHEYGGISAGALGTLTKTMNPDLSSWGTSNRHASITSDAYDRLSDEYQEMVESISGVTLEQLERDSVPVKEIEEALA